jgi:hypothetical protein
VKKTRHEEEPERVRVFATRSRRKSWVGLNRWAVVVEGAGCDPRCQITWGFCV